MILSPLIEALKEEKFFADETASLPRLQRATVKVPRASIAALKATPFTLVPGVAGKIMVPEYIHIYKQAGVAWTCVGAGRLWINWGTTTACMWSIFDEALLTTFLGAAADTWIAASGGTAGNVGSYGVLANGNVTLGAPIQMELETAEVTVGTGDLTVNIWYRTWGLVTP